jgi:hypothetical protein
MMSTEADDEMECESIEVGTRAYRDAHGLPDPPGTAFFVEVRRADGFAVPIIFRGVGDLVMFTRELNPPLIHLFATNDERPALVAEIRSHMSEHEAHALMRADPAPDLATLH